MSPLVGIRASPPLVIMKLPESGLVGVPLVGEGLGFAELVGEGLGLGELLGAGFGLGELLGAGFGLGELVGEGLGLLVVELVGETGLVEEGCGFGCWFPEELATGDFRSFEGDTLTAGFCIGFADGWFWEEIGDREVG
jgi:hypothetical protein